MSRNGAGVYNLPTGNPVVTGTTIQSSWANNTLTDIATALTGSIAANGETPITANLPMAGFKHTGVGASNALTDYARTDQVQNSSSQWLTTVAGVDTITATATPTPSAYVAGQKFRFVPVGANTGAVTLNISGLGAKAITKQGTTALVAGDIPANCEIEVVYGGTQFQLINNYAGNAAQTFSVAPATAAAHAIPSSNINGAIGAPASGTTLGAAHANRTISCVSATPLAYTMPAASSAANVHGFCISNIGAGAVTLTAAGSDVFYAKGLSGVSSITINQGEQIYLISDGTASWLVKSFSSGMTGTFTATGTGFSGSVTATWAFRIVNGVCFISIPATLSGTSNANTFTVTGLPASCTPGSTRLVPVWGQDVGATVTTAYASVSGTTISFGTAAAGLTGWTTSGAKGLVSTEIAYVL